mmetsp:Transcript_49782/g.153735  ORF Transcript_49782/g.153735 Transcript_49782/m.153735 type:complete len:373 (-) Transcript_49782:57-1175(-)
MQGARPRPPKHLGLFLLLKLLLLRGLAVLAVPRVHLRELGQVLGERVEGHLADHHGLEELLEAVLVHDSPVHAELLLLQIDGNHGGEAKLKRELLLDLELVAALQPHEARGRVVRLALLEDRLHDLQVVVPNCGATIQDVRQEGQDTRAVLAVLPELGVPQQLLHPLGLLAAQLDELQCGGELLGLRLQSLGLAFLLLDLDLHALDLLAALPDGHLLGLLEDLPLLCGAALLVLQAALRPGQVCLHVPLQALVLTRPVVVLAPAGVRVLLEDLDGRIAPHLVLAAERLAGGRAVDVGDEHRPGALVVLMQLVPLRLQLRAVASPWREELHKGVLAFDGAEEGLLSQLHCRCCQLHGGCKAQQSSLHGGRQNA